MEDSPITSGSFEVSAEALFAIFQLLPHAAGKDEDFEALCEAYPTAAAGLRALRGFDSRAPADTATGASAAAAGDVLARVARHGDRAERYHVDGEIARGGMGTILRVWDAHLGRHLAMKVAPPADPGTPSQAAARLARFLEEAMVSAQLDHPGIVPVHDLGLDGEGRVFFTMKLVRGRTLQQIFGALERGEDDWTETRVLHLVLKACEAMSYAHAKGIIHRDLKPSNLMVGRFGEVFVMDWGVAKVVGRTDGRDLRVRPRTAPQTEMIRRPLVGADAGDSPLVTMDGHVLGTPAYMSPEQAAGRVAEMGPASDVYALGAMLYHLIAKQIPYGTTDGYCDPHAILFRVQAGPPRQLAELAPTAAAELVAICEKAMARDPNERYSDVSALAQDLSAYLEGRVVRAYETGARAELRKWMRRNRALACSLAAGLVLALVGLASVATVQARERRVADEQRKIADARTVDVLRLSAFQDLEELVARADALWPPHPEHLDAYREWIAAAERLVADLPWHRAKRDELRLLASPLADGGGNGGEGGASAWVFPPEEDEARWWHAQLTRLIDELEALRDPATGLLAEDGFSPQSGSSIVQRLRSAEWLRDGFARGGAFAESWEKALPALRAAYPGLDLAPRMGLVPLGPDPRSNLWEFGHLLTGAPAERDADGALRLSEESGVVLVLLPGGETWIGSQSEEPGGPNFDPDAKGSVRRLTVPSAFVSKYEMTQGQWERLTRRNPSQFGGTRWRPEWLASGAPASRLHAVEGISWHDARTWLGRAGLAIPGEALWEYAARAGTDTPWWTGMEKESLAGAANLLDDYNRLHGDPNRTGHETWLDDGAAKHAPVGSYDPNAFGLHDVVGNVWEWCFDPHRGDRSQPLDPAEPVDAHSVPDEGSVFFCVARGGSFHYPAYYGRATYRSILSPSLDAYDLGVRPARPLAP